MTDETGVATQLRIALRRLAKAVVIATSRHEGMRFAMAATAVSELSLQPPSLLLCVNKSASLYLPLSAGAHFCINILHSTHRNLADLCSGKIKGEARFASGDWALSSNGVPYLKDAQASVVCNNDQTVNYGSHGIFIGRVVEVFSHGPVDPLVYVDGSYTALNAAVRDSDQAK